MSKILATLLFLGCIYAALSSPLAKSKRNADDFVDAHNTKRKEVLATKMNELKWDTTLANSASACASQCKFQHCAYGENIFLTSGSEPTAEAAVASWFKEQDDYDLETGCNPGKVCGHYTQVVWEKTTTVGCAVQQCPTIDVFGSLWTDAWLVVCQYNPPGNMLGEVVYEEGARCTKCENEGQLMCLNHLCSTCDQSPSDCTCELLCQNGGTLIQDGCTCNCPEGYSGTVCQDSP